MKVNDDLNESNFSTQIHWLMMWWSGQKYFWTLNLTKSWFLFINQLCKAWKVWKYEHQVQEWTKERRWWGGASQNDFISFSSSSFISVWEFLLQTCAIKMHWGNNFVIGQIAIRKASSKPNWIFTITNIAQLLTKTNTNKS